MNEDENKEQLRVAYYLRVSTDDQTLKYGLPVQKEALDSVIKARGNFIDGRPAMVFAGDAYIYEDDGISGTVELNERPAFAKLKEDILLAGENKPFDAVAVFKIDRFARKLTILLDVIKFLEDHNIEFISATESIDTSSPFGRAMLGIMGVIAELEVETIKERTKKGRDQAVKDGVYLGSSAPFGYQKDKNKRLQILPVEEEIVKQIFNMFLMQKMSPQNIADELTGREILSPSASAVQHNKRKGGSNKTNEPHFWRPDAVRNIIDDEVYTGKYFYNKTKDNKKHPKEKWKLSPYRHSTIIPQPLYDMAQKRLDEYSRRANLTKRKEKDHIYLLSGLLRCDHCKDLPRKDEEGMTSWHGTKKKVSPGNYSYGYICGRKNSKKYSQLCSTIPLPADDIEQYVVDFATQLLTNPRAVFEYQKQLRSTKLSEKKLKKDLEHFRKLRNSLPDRRKNIKKQHEIGVIKDLEELKASLEKIATQEKKLNQKIGEIEYKLSQLGLTDGYFKSIELFAQKYADTMDEVLKDREQLYNLINKLVNKIIVYSRLVTKKDSIAGRKKDKQHIPDKVDIYLNLPQVLMKELFTQQFGVRTASL